jgi:hypothetical protein
MPDQPTQPTANDRFKPEMPQIPGVSAAPARYGGGRRRSIVAGGLIFLILAVVVAVRILSKPRRAESSPPAVAQIDVPAPIPDLAASVPVATEANPAIATIGELAKPWSSKTFEFHDHNTGAAVAAILIRLPGGSASQSSGYWSLAMKPIYGDCQLDYVQDLQKLRNDYGYWRATHPMIANPCTRSLYDPLKYATLPGDILARGLIVQGAELRPPLSIEVKIKGNQILATRME